MMPLLPIRACCLLALGLNACSLQPPAATPLPARPVQWSHAADTPADARSEAHPDGAATAQMAGERSAADPWQALQDPAWPRLLQASEADAPTVAAALARVAQSRARLAAAGGAALPQLAASVQGSRGNGSGSPGGTATPLGSASAATGSNSTAFNALGTTSSTPVSTSASAALSVSWDADLFGRLKAGRAAAQARLDASQADARLARITLRAQLADALILARACQATVAQQQISVTSAERTLELVQIKRGAGFSSPLDEARSRTSVGDARTTLINTEGQCEQDRQSLAVLAGLAIEQVRATLASTRDPRAALQVPTVRLSQPAAVLARHPSILKAQRTADAAYESVGQARAARYPSVSLAGLLSSTRIQVDALSQTFNSWSFGPSLNLALFDGGQLDAAIAEARGAYQEALANLAQAVRDTVRDTELALIASQTAQRAAVEAESGALAAQALFAASDAAQRAGRLSLFDLETARSALLNAELARVNAERERARAWVALLKATAGEAPAVESP